MAEQVITPEVLKFEAQQRNQKLYDALLDELPLSARIAAEPSELRTGIVQVLYAAEKIFQEMAQKVMADNKRGAKGHADGLRNAASRVSSLALGMHQHGIPDLDRSAPTSSETASQLISNMLTESSMLPEGVTATFEPLSFAPGDELVIHQNSSGLLDITPTEGQEVLNLTWNSDVTKAIHGDPKTPAEEDPGSLDLGGGPRCNCKMPWHYLGEPGCALADQPEESPAVTETPVPAPNPFSFAEPKSWAEVHMPNLPVRDLHTPEDQWRPAPDYASHTQLDMAASCGTRYWLRYRLGVAGRPSWASIGGSTLHYCVQEIEGKASAGFTPSKEEVDKAWTDYFSAITTQTADDSPYPIASWHASNRGKEGPDWWRADGPEMVHRYLEWRAKWMAEGWSLLVVNGHPAVELKVMAFMGGKATKVIIDQVWQRGNQLAFIDLKSGSAKPADHFQLATAAQALKFAVGDYTQAGVEAVGAFWDARSGDLGELVDIFARHPIAEIEHRYGMLAKMNAAGVYIPNTNGAYGGCGSCFFKLSCPVGNKA